MAERFNLVEYAYAHRGLWRGDGAPENSLKAFKAAADAGLGIELDVRPAKDGTPVCFHDPFLDRTSSSSGLVSLKTTAELQSCSLSNGEPIPLLTDVLEVFSRQLPILVELKIDGETDPVSFTQSVSDIMERYEGKAAMMSFSEQSTATIPATIMSGQLIAPSSMIGLSALEEKIAQAEANSLDYLALHISDANAKMGRSMPTACWTITEENQRQKLKALSFAEIFEHLPSPLAAQ